MISWVGEFLIELWGLSYGGGVSGLWVCGKGSRVKLAKKSIFWYSNIDSPWR